MRQPAILRGFSRLTEQLRTYIAHVVHPGIDLMHLHAVKVLLRLQGSAYLLKALELLPSKTIEEVLLQKPSQYRSCNALLFPAGFIKQNKGRSLFTLGPLDPAARLHQHACGVYGCSHDLQA